MQYDAYQKETEQIALYQSDVLHEAGEKLKNGIMLSKLETNGVLHALQVIVENAIGKAKHIIKMEGGSPPISGYDSILMLVDLKRVPQELLSRWNNAVGLRNKIVHDYMNIRMDVVFELVKNEEYIFIIDFLLSPMTKESEGNNAT